MFELFEEEELN